MTSANTDPLRPIDPYNDDRVTHEYAVLNGKRYHYVLGTPKTTPIRGTVLCIHGFPDIWYGYRHIIPSLLSLGLRVIVPDMLGYGLTDAPQCPPTSLTTYSWKSTASDMAALLAHLSIPSVILLGHDWGGVIIYRIYQYFPSLVSHIMCICTSYRALQRQYFSLDDIVKKVPNFVYQVGLINPETERDLEDPVMIERFLKALHRGDNDPPKGRMRFMVREKMMENLGDQPVPKKWNEKEWGYYRDMFVKRGMHGPLNWYRLTEINYQDEKDLPKDKEPITVPVMWVGANRDFATPAAMGKSQTKYFTDLTSYELPTSHWVMDDMPGELNALIAGWIKRRVFADGKSKI
ncbi:alpha/beta-hydrolase [Ascodesmis nigricans]|uniref:Alpha/beta-hydrolase n=1 Tax=Ascodesmis nigricans TaxID=341454 RepID=A0A4S2MKJ3_9PEZI|nr:alpha/beta-hydrolase [Ascodesmis nigricans]